MLREMVVTDLKVRYQNSVLGYIWSLLKPLFLFAILYIVFIFIIPLGKDVEHYPVYLLTGVVVWNFFTEATTMGTMSVVLRENLIRKISIPTFLIVLASQCAALINLGLNLIVIFIFSILNGIQPGVDWLLLVPLVVELFMLTFGISLFLSSFFVKYRDILYIWEIATQAGFYATPIIYPLMSVPSCLHKWFFINPMAQIIQDARYIIATKTSVNMWSTIHSAAVIIPFMMVSLVFVVGVVCFKQRSRFFAEDI